METEESSDDEAEHQAATEEELDEARGRAR
jgi:hypothetical protein